MTPREKLLDIKGTLLMLLGSEALNAGGKFTPRMTDIIDTIKPIEYLLEVYYPTTKA